MRPQSLSEQLMYTTVRIETQEGVGTGSFFLFSIENKIVPVIITNKHVVNYNENEVVTFNIHTKNVNSEPDKNVKITYQTKWIFHEKHDLCCCYAQPIFEYMEKTLDCPAFFIANDEKIIPTKEQLEGLSAVEELIMVGYPIGLSDVRNNLPIFRRGYTACHPSIDFNKEENGLVDMACFPGSSGSPIYVLNEGSYKIKNGALCAGDRLILLGYLYAGPTFNANGTISIEEIPTSQQLNVNTKVMINLGYYIKASAVYEFKEKIRKELEEKNNLSESSNQVDN
jgi:hypothetical protein